MLIQKYNPTWPSDYEKIKAILNDRISSFVTDIQHVGSTAVPGLDAKPIIDIDIIFKENANFENIKMSLKHLGYYHNGNQRIEGREVFKRDGKVFDEVLDNISHHLYLCQADCLELQRHLLFRDYLRKDELTRNYYMKLKYEVANEVNENKKRYAEMKQIRINPFIDYVIELEKRKLQVEIDFINAKLERAEQRGFTADSQEQILNQAKSRLNVKI